MSDEIAKLKELIQRHSDSGTVLPREEGAHCVEFLSKQYDDLHLFRGIAKDKLQRLSTKLEALKAKVDTIGNAIDEIQEYSFQYNVKIVGVPERLQDDSTASISKLCLNIFKETGADVSMYDIDTAHRVPSRNNNGKPKPIVCKFVRRLTKESVMNHRKDACKLNPTSVGQPENASLSAVRIFDHLSPRMQTVLFEAKKFKEQHRPLPVLLVKGLLCLLNLKLTLKLNREVNLKILDNNSELVSLERKTYVKYLGVLIIIDGNLSWKHHINYISTKISKGIGIVARLRHLVPRTTLLKIYCSLIEPYISYGLVAWGQAANAHLNKIVILQKRVLRLMYFSDYTSHSAPLFVCSGILPIKMLYFKLVASLLHDIENHCATPNISELFTRSEQVHSYPTRFSVAGSFYVKQARTNHQLFSFSRVGAKIWNGIPPELRELRKAPFKRKLTHLLLKILETEEMNVDMRYIDLSSFC